MEELWIFWVDLMILNLKPKSHRKKNSISWVSQILNKLRMSPILICLILVEVWIWVSQINRSWANKIRKKMRAIHPYFPMTMKIKTPIILSEKANRMQSKIPKVEKDKINSDKGRERQMFRKAKREKVDNHRAKPGLN